MEFNEEQARRLIRKHNLTPAIYRTWKHRNKIPTKYLNDKLFERPFNRKEKREHERLARILQTDKLNLEELSEFALLDHAQLKAFCTGEIQELPHGDFVKLRSSIEALRLRLSTLLDEIDNHNMDSDRRARIVKQLIKLPCFSAEGILKDSGLVFQEAYEFAYDDKADMERRKKQKIVHSYTLMAHQLSFQVVESI